MSEADSSSRPGGPDAVAGIVNAITWNGATSQFTTDVSVNNVQTTMQCTYSWDGSTGTLTINPPSAAAEQSSAPTRSDPSSASPASTTETINRIVFTRWNEETALQTPIAWSGGTSGTAYIVFTYLNITALSGPIGKVQQQA